MAYDGVLCGIIARQLAAELASAKIEKIQQPEYIVYGNTTKVFD